MQPQCLRTQPKLAQTSASKLTSVVSASCCAATCFARGYTKWHSVKPSTLLRNMAFATPPQNTKDSHLEHRKRSRPMSSPRVPICTS
eukprot:4677757-Amphidinium_carterae.1